MYAKIACVVETSPQPCSEEVGEKLLEDCKAGDLDTVFCHLDSGVDVNFRNEVRLQELHRRCMSVHYYVLGYTFNWCSVYTG